MKKLSKGKPSTSRLPAKFTNMVILEETESLHKNYCKGDIKNTPLCLITDLKMEKIWKTVKAKQEITLTSEDFFALIEYDCDVREFTISKLEKIEKETNLAMNFYMKKENKRERRAVYHCVVPSENEDFDRINLIVKDRKPFTDDTRIKVTGVVFKDISAKRTTFCKSCDLPFTRFDNFQRHESNETACSTETVIRPVSKEYGREINVPEQLFKAGFILEEHLNFKQTNYACYDIVRVQTSNLA